MKNILMQRLEQTDKFVELLQEIAVSYTHLITSEKKGQIVKLKYVCLM